MEITNERELFRCLLEGKITRREFFRRAIGMGLSMGTVVALLQASGDSTALADEPTTITIDPADHRGKVKPLVFGTNHRYEYSGYTMWDAEQYRATPEFVTKFERSGITATRFPGGTVSNLYHWQRAIGPVDERPDNVHGGHGGRGGPVSNEFGPDEWGRFMDVTGTTGSVVVNFASGTAREAADWVAYMNATSGHWAELRAANGHPEPYGIKYWEVGNEFGYGGQAYWFDGSPEEERPSLYAFGGGNGFEGQRVGLLDDYRDSAAVSDGSPSQAFYAKYPPVKPDSQTVYVGGDAWTETSDLSTADPEDAVYNLDGTTGKITFGDGSHGKIPVAGAVVTIDYVSGPHDGFVDFYEAMKSVDPSISVCSGFNPFQKSRVEAFIEAMGTEHPYDCIVLHPYRNVNDATTADEYHDRIMLKPADAAQFVADLQARARAISGRPIEVAVTEYSIFSRKGVAPNYQLALGGALYVAESFNHWLNLGIPVAMKHTLIGWLFSNDNPSGRTDHNAMFSAAPDFVATPTALAFELYTSMMGTELVASSVTNNPARTLDDGGVLTALQTISSADDDGTLYLIVINRDRERDVTARVRAYRYLNEPRQATVKTLTGPSYGSYNSPENPNAVTVTERTITVPPTEFSYVFPALSVTAIRLEGVVLPGERP